MMLNRQRKIARAMITQYGMSDRFGLMGLESIQNKYLDGRAVLNCGEATAGEIDEEVMKMLKSRTQRRRNFFPKTEKLLIKSRNFSLKKKRSQEKNL